MARSRTSPSPSFDQATGFQDALGHGRYSYWRCSGAIRPHSSMSFDFSLACSSPQHGLVSVSISTRFVQTSYCKTAAVKVAMLPPFAVIFFANHPCGPLDRNSGTAEDDLTLCNSVLLRQLVQAIRALAAVRPLRGQRRARLDVLRLPAGGALRRHGRSRWYVGMALALRL